MSGVRARRATAGSACKTVLVYPNKRQIAMTNLGFTWVRELLDRLPGVSCESAVLDPDNGRTLSLESGSPLSEFDLVAFSQSFELDHLNVVGMLRAGGVEPLAQARPAGAPYVIAGGIAAAINPEPLAQIVDAFALGEAEALLPKLGPFLAQGPDRIERARWLRELADLPGIYVPRFYRWDPLRGHLPEPGLLRRVRYLRCEAAPEEVPVSPAGAGTSQFGDALIVEVGRGCGRGCRFCVAGRIYRPVRFQPMARLREVIDRRLIPGREIGLQGTAVSDHPQIAELIRELADEGHRVSLSSIRAGSFGPEQYADLARSGLQQVALAPEAGSERLRGLMGKRIDDEVFVAEAEQIAAAGIKRVKLYFMSGLPTQTAADVEAVAALARRIRGVAGNRLRVLVGLTPFVPKPHTELQWHPYAHPKEHAAMVRRVRELLRHERGISVSAESARLSQVQSLLARGDRDLYPLLHSGEKGISAALRAWGGKIDEHTGRPRKADEPFPWEIVDVGVERGLLYQGYQRVIEATD
ncbi:MAG: radical SAM protein [Candidatus Alcyoniella australis]|nr:radical SAM protein [Candidatus Alcyoniella australis]